MALNYARTIKLFQEDKGYNPRGRTPERKFPHAAKSLSEAFKSKAVTLSDFDLGKLFSETYGHGEFADLRSNNGDGVSKVMEAGGGVSQDAFLTITQQFIYSTVIPEYEAPEFKFSRRIPDRQSPFRYERVPGVANLGDQASVVDEFKEFPIATVSEDYRETPDTEKRGFQVPISKEAVFFDRTGLVVKRASDVAKWMGVNKERRAIRAFIDAGETDTEQYRYRWKGVSSGALIVAIATYGANSGDHNWNNLQTANGLQDYNNLNNAWLLFQAMRDPFTTMPISDMIKTPDIVYPPILELTVPFAIGGMVRRANPGYATSGNPTVTEIDNPAKQIVGTPQPLSSQLLADAMSAAGLPATAWWIGDIRQALEYVYNWPITVLSLGAGSQMEYTHDIVASYRVSERGTFAWAQPRFVVYNTP